MNILKKKNGRSLEKKRQKKKKNEDKKEEKDGLKQLSVKEMIQKQEIKIRGQNPKLGTSNQGVNK